LARRSRLDKLVEETLVILAAIGIPLDSLTTRRREKMAKAFLSVAGMKPGMSWSEARSDNRLRSRDIIRWMNENLGEDISSGSYDDIRRKDLLLPVEVGIVVRSATNETAATNDGTRTYALSVETAALLHTFATPPWQEFLADFLRERTTIADQLKRLRQSMMIPVTLDGEQIFFGPGEHNKLQKAIIEQFLPRFGNSSEVLYVGDTEDKLLFRRDLKLRELGFFELSHDKLPDIVAWSATKNWLFLIEAVYSANPITELRKRTLDALTQSCTSDIVYVSAFLDRTTFRKFAKDIAWETEVWIAESPDHLIHFNGDKFLGPHAPTGQQR